MAGIVYLLFFLAGGLLIARYWLPGLRPLPRWYAGAGIGLMLVLWLPALWARAVAFTVTAHLLAALTLLVAVMAAWMSRDRAPRVRVCEEDRRMLRAVLLVAVPLTLLAAWLEFTHSLRPAVDGYHVGQSTYGDLSLHLAIATSAVNAPFPLHNSLMVGATMAYPYLSDTFATTFLLLGADLPTAMAVTGTVLCAYVFVGFALLCAQLCRRRGAVFLAFGLLFINGGLGFFYTLSGTVENGVVTTAWDHLRTVLTSYYQTPTNQPDPNNLRWVNILCDMLVPQRGFLGGWAMLMPILNLVLPPLMLRRRPRMRAMLLAGLMAGGLPMLHTHTFLALGLASLGFCGYAMATAPHGRRADAFAPFALYGCIAAVLAMPQLTDFTFVQATASDHFLRFQFNWCNNRNGQGLVDPYFWFYIKNIGVPYLLILLAVFQRRQGDLRTEAEQAAVLTDGLYTPEPEPQPEVEAAHELQPEPEPEPEPEEEAPAPEPAAPPAADAEPGAEAEAETLAPGRHSVFTADMPAYGMDRMEAVHNAPPLLNVELPYVRPLPPEKLRASAFSPEDNDRVGVMRAVTGDAKPEQSHRPLLEELFHATYRQQDEVEERFHAHPTTVGAPETCFADNPPPRDWIRQNRILALGALLIVLVAELILFQPNEYDNNKLFYVAYLLCLPMAADYALELYARLRGIGGAKGIAALFLITCFLSGGLTIARETVSDYPAYSVADQTVATFVQRSTPEHSVFLTGTQHLNPVASLAGRTIVCGSDLYLYYHGFSTAPRKAEVQAFYEAPREHLDLLSRYGVEYIYVSPSEWAAYTVNAQALRSLFPVLYESDDGNTLILTVPEALRKAGTAQPNPFAPVAP